MLGVGLPNLDRCGAHLNQKKQKSLDHLEDTLNFIILGHHVLAENEGEN